MSALAENPPPARKSLWIPGIIIGAFLSLFAIEARFVVLAVRSRSGLVNENPYLQGVHYNDTLAEQARERALGWRIAIAYRARGALRGVVTIGLFDKNGVAINGTYEVTALRITDQYQAIPLKLVHDTANFAANVPGRWFVKVTAHHDDKMAERTQEIFVQP